MSIPHIPAHQTKLESSEFSTFLVGYWNQTGAEIYVDFAEALSDFRKLEGEIKFRALISQINALIEKNFFTSINSIESSHDNPFWDKFDMIVTLEDLLGASFMLGLR